MTDNQAEDPAARKWVRRFLLVKALSMGSMVACMAYMLLWENSQKDLALIWLGLTIFFSFVGARWCRWNLRRVRESADETAETGDNR